MDALKKEKYSLRGIGVSNALLYTPRVRNAYKLFVSTVSSLFDVDDDDDDDDNNNNYNNNNNSCNNHMRSLLSLPLIFYSSDSPSLLLLLVHRCDKWGGSLTLAHTGRHHFYKGISHPQIHSL